MQGFTPQESAEDYSSQSWAMLAPLVRNEASRGSGHPTTTPLLGNQALCKATIQY
jgi:hypothetical protein